MYRIFLITYGLFCALLFATCEGGEDDAGWAPTAGGDADTDTDTDTDGDSDSDADGDGDGDSDGDMDGDSDGDGDDQDGGTDDDVCDKWNIDIELAPARMMILQDVSGSMTEGTPTKWQQAKQALIGMFNNFNLNLEFGFDKFPNNALCGVGQPVVSDCAQDNAANIVGAINNISPVGGTPLYVAMKRFTDQSYAPNFLSPDATSYLLVVSDGTDTCGINGNPYAAQGATAQQLASITSELLTNHEIQTFVIGFGAGADPAQLNAIATAGGTSMTNYIDAQNQQQLEQALNTIGSSAVSCVYDIGEQDDNDVDMDEVNFYFDDNVVGYDEACDKETGWTWANDEKSRVEFCQAACDELQSGDVEKIEATFGCKQAVVR